MNPGIRSLVAGAAVVATLLGPTLARAADIVDTAVAAGSFNTLVTAVKAAGLVKTLKGKGPYTVFAPNDAAFAKLPPGTVESLLKNKAKLATILKYHVVPGRVKAADVAGKSLKVKTAAGLPVNVDGTFGVRVNDAHVIQPDIEASNGVIHVIDTVLLPPAAGKKSANIEACLRRTLATTRPVSAGLNSDHHRPIRLRVAKAPSPQRKKSARSIAPSRTSTSRRRRPSA